jgi:glycerol uptake operon antiterminator
MEYAPLIKKRKIMQPEEFRRTLHETPVILAVKSMEHLTQCLELEHCGIFFVLFGDLLTIPEIVSRIKEAGKAVVVHLDLIDGLASRDAAIDFIREKTFADGVISTKTGLVRYAKSQGLIAIQRFFVLDSMSILNIEKQLPLDYADAIEILPGIIPKIIRRIAVMTKTPIIAGGLIADREDVQLALEAGAVSVSASSKLLF